MLNILVTGGSGYIGSHTVLALLTAGHTVTVLDNLCNSNIEALNRVQQLTSRQLRFVKGDITSHIDLSSVFDRVRFDSVIHFAGYKAVGESVDNPLLYYHNNVQGTINLCRAMSLHNVKKLVFSSSATVYGVPQSLPLREDSVRGEITNPYGRTKAIIEDCLNDLCASDSEWSITCLRYFNPVGAHESGLIGEDPTGTPNNLMPFISQVASGIRPILYVFGNDFDTNDGTGVRDYIHVMDLADGHLKALNKLIDDSGFHTYNLGTGSGHSVLELVSMFEKINQVKVPYKIVDRRPGDVAECYASADLAFEKLQWQSTRDIKDMCRDTWRWQSMNPNGYKN